MERAKKARAPHRTAIGRIINKLDTELEKPTVDAEVVETLRDKLLHERETLSALNDKILEALLDADESEENIQAEFDGAQSYTDRIDLYLKKLSKLSCFTENNSNGSSENESNMPPRKYKLPKIELQKFSGDLKTWLGWWSQFRRIHEDTELHKNDKFHYLIQATEADSEAREIVAAYPPTSDNYDEAIEALRERYGRENLQLQLYIRELLNLVITNATSPDKLPIQSLYIKLDSYIRSLKSLNLSNEDPSTYFYPLVESCLTEDLLRAWRRCTSIQPNPTEGSKSENDLDVLMGFLKKEVRNEQQIQLARSGFGSNQSANSSEEKGESKLRTQKKRLFEKTDLKQNVPTAAGLLTAKPLNCIFCNKPHASQECGNLGKMGLDEKRAKVKEKGACFVCLKPGHRSRVCKNFVKCHVCSKRHFTNMCPEVATKKVKLDETVAVNSNIMCKNDVLLKTLVVCVKGPQGKVRVRLISDEGSQSSHIGRSVVEKTGSQKVGSNVTRNVLFGGKVTAPTRENLRQVEIESLDGKVNRKWVLRERAVICPGIPRIPKGPWLHELLKINVHPVDTDDVDVDLPNVEILIGQDLLNEMVTNERIKLNDRLAAVKTIFGWCICGPISETNDEKGHVSLFHGRPSVQDLWSLELLGVRDPTTTQTEEQINAEAKSHFNEHVRRRQGGRYVVRLPWIVEEPTLWKSNEKAKERLIGMTKRLKAKNKFLEYHTIFEQWLSEGLIEESCSTKYHLMPHHAVYKPNSKTTPVRPVFNASFKVPGCPSLNECLHKGPNLLELIPNLINNFRVKSLGVVADIRKAFQTIEVDEKDRDFQSFMWWDNHEAKKMKLYRHTRVVFGVNASPFLLASVLETHFKNVCNEDKAVAESLKGSFYVDNLVTSLNDMQEYEDFKTRTIKILSDAQMEITQWEHTGARDHADGQEKTKVLGLVWNKLSDEISIDVDEILVPEKLTKRSALSMLHRVFDPQGFLAPATLPMKLLLQLTWKDKLGWDEEISKSMQTEVNAWAEDMRLLGEVKIPRKMFVGKDVQLHIFVDASQRAFAAAAFLRSFGSYESSVILVQAKSRVAPLKQISIPRLELLSCLLGSRLASSIKSSLKLSDDKCFYWSDSTTAISWINRESNWNVFVRNRVAEIRKLSINPWRYVPSEMNLADLPSRGCTPKRLLEVKWWTGKSWLYNEATWPNQVFEVEENLVRSEEAKASCSLTLLEKNEKRWFHPKFRMFSQNVRVMVYVLRFLKCCQKERIQSEISEDELKNAEIHILKSVQYESFDGEFFRRSKLKLIKRDGLHRILSKLTNDDHEAFSMPILLPAQHPVVDQIIEEAHITSFHAGTQVLMSRLREKYWMLRARKTIQRVVGKCVTCRRHSSKPAAVAAAPLPEYRTKTGDIFETTGVDLAGPLTLISGEKAWVVLFTCAVYRAVYLDLVMSLSASDFLACLQRFICHFGRPSTLCSDQGTNFVATKNLVDISDFDVKNDLKLQGVRWVLNPPSAPWWGGWWERLIKSVKDQLKRILGKARINYDQLRTCLAVTMATMNDRPLTSVTQDADDLVPLTPSMFMHPLRVTRFSENLEPERLPFAYRKMQSLVRSLKQRFKKEYLALLVQKKHDHPTPIAVGDLVLVGMDKKRVEWPLGRVAALIPGRDGQCRVAKIRTSTGVLVRPLQRLFPLEFNSENKNLGLEKLEKTRYGRVVKSPSYFMF